MADYRYNADSWDEFVRDITTRKELPAWTGSCDSDQRGVDDWAGSRTFNEALSFLTKGYAPARDALDACAVKVSMEPEPMWDVAPVGAFPCIPACAAGVPEDMFVPNEGALTPSPIVRIAVNVSASAAVDPQHIVNRGAALVELIDRIQISGRRVEVIAFEHVGLQNRDRGIFTITVKRPEEAVDIDRIGLALASPVMLRRYLFRVMEFTVPYLQWGYGFPSDFKEEYRDCDLTIPHITGNEYRTMPLASAMVQNLWNKAASKEAA